MTTQVVNNATTAGQVPAAPRSVMGPRPATLYGTAADTKLGVTTTTTTTTAAAASAAPSTSAQTTTAAPTTTVVAPNQTNGSLSSGTMSPGIMTGRPVFGGGREEATHHASLFIGDLGPEVSACGIATSRVGSLLIVIPPRREQVDDASLRSAFERFPTLSECRVMFDPNTGRSRGYGFASFADQEDAQRALTWVRGER